jgi:hypothetical protein
MRPVTMTEDEFLGMFRRSLSSTWADPSRIPSIDQTAQNFWDDLTLAGYEIRRINDNEDVH